jgi:DNA-binding transcriptional ArsR family regulator
MSFEPMTGLGLDELTFVFRLLGEKTRLQIVLLLAESEKNVGELCAAMSLPQPMVSHHLGLLRMHNVITNRRNGKQIFYTLSGMVTVDPQKGISIELGLFRVQISTAESFAVHRKG